MYERRTPGKMSKSRVRVVDALYVCPRGEERVDVEMPGVSYGRTCGVAYGRLFVA